MLCHKHGEQMLIPNNVLSGCGCRKCGYEKVSEKNSDSPEIFIEKSIKGRNGPKNGGRVKLCQKKGKF